MPRYVLSLQDLGEAGSWLIVQQARGIPDARTQTDFMTERVALLLFAQESLPERLCITAAVRQMNGATLYQGTVGDWREELHRYQAPLLGVINYYVDCMYLYGFPASVWAKREADVKYPVINAGSPDGHPAHALADIACMLKYSRDNLRGVRVGWVGCANGTLYSLIEAMQYFPYTLQVSLPPRNDPAAVRDAARRFGVELTLVDTPEQAVAGTQYVFAGCRSELAAEDEERWSITPALLDKATPGAHVLLGAQPIRAITVDRGLAESFHSLLLLQAENRLRVHKRLLHWVFLEN